MGKIYLEFSMAKENVYMNEKDKEKCKLKMESLACPLDF